MEYIIRRGKIEDLKKVELDKDLISSDELQKSIKEARKEYKKGKSIVAKSM